MVTEYALTSAQDFSNSDPGAWHLLASNDDGRSWTVLDIQTNQTFKERSQRRLFSIRNRIAYNTYRLQVDTTADVALAELELIGPLAGATNEVDLQALVSASGEHTLIGPATQAFDGDPSTKWIDFGTGESKARWIQCQYTLQNEMVASNISQFLVIARRMATRNRLLDKAPEILSKLSARASLPVRPLTGYALTSANDAPVRDPRDWKLLGSNDGGKIWRILDVRRNESFARRFQRRAFTLSKEAACALSASRSTRSAPRVLLKLIQSNLQKSSLCMPRTAPKAGSLLWSRRKGRTHPWNWPKRRLTEMLGPSGWTLAKPQVQRSPARTQTDQAGFNGSTWLTRTCL
jgi:hypothetical protein